MKTYTLRVDLASCHIESASVSQSSVMPKSKSSERQMSIAAAALGRLGGKARSRRLTAEQLREIGLRGAAARWAKKPPKTGAK
jgi:hypothetical protein